MNGIKLLVVDDEPALLNLVRRYLEKLGYQVDTSSDAQDALAKFAADPQAYNLVIADLMLNGMTGEDMLEQMRKMNPEIRGLISSGYPHEPRLPGVGFLQKPYLPNMLTDAVEQALKPKR